MKGFLKALPLSFQHLFAMFGATILVPALTGLDPGSALVASGVGTLIFHLITRGKVPTYLGSSFAFIAPLALYAGELNSPGQAVAGLIAVSIVYAIVAIIISSVGIEKVRKAIPPVVVGPVVSIIGLALAAMVVTSMASINWDVAIVSLLAAIIATLAGTKTIRIFPLIIGLGVGYIYAMVRGLVEFSTIANAPGSSPSAIRNARIHVGRDFGMAPIALVTIIEDLGHMLVLKEITDKDVIKDPGFSSVLWGNGLSNINFRYHWRPCTNDLRGKPRSFSYHTPIFQKSYFQGAAVIAILS